MKLDSPFEPWGEHIAVELPGARGVFTTRRGGLSEGPYATLNLGRLTDDSPAAVERNRELLSAAIGLPLAGIRQVHGSAVKRLEQLPGPDEAPEEVDGQATAVAGLAPVVLVADCLPVLVAGGGAAAVLHAGWRGLAAGILEEGVRAVRELGEEEAEREAAIGPGARACCYEVGEEVHRQFAAYGPLARRGANLDLAAIARHRLKACGVASVHDLEACTICGDASLWFSHRRDRGVTGRQAAAVWLS